MKDRKLVMERAVSDDVAETSGYGRRLTQLTPVNPLGQRGVRRGGRTDKGDVKSAHLPLNISCVENLVWEEG